MTGSYLRCCAICSAHILTSDNYSINAYCAAHQPARQDFNTWAAGLQKGDRVFLQPYAAWRGLSHSEYLIVDRTEDTLTVQLIGYPESRMEVGVAHCARNDVTPRPRYGAAW